MRNWKRLNADNQFVPPYFAFVIFVHFLDVAACELRCIAAFASDAIAALLARLVVKLNLVIAVIMHFYHF